MDGAGCLAEPLSGPSRPTEAATATARRALARRRGFASVRDILRRAGRLGALGRRLNARMEKFDALRPPRGFGLAGAALIIFGSIIFGAIRGGHIDEVVESLRNARDTAANAAGFNITGVALAGHKHLTREEIFAIAGVTGHSSLLFLDLADARARLKTNPWIADATVQKLYPDRLQITITERVAFALWQKGGSIGRRDRRRGHGAGPLYLPACRQPAAFRRRGRGDPRQGFSHAARALSGPARAAARLGAGGRAALEPAAQERRRRAAAGIRRRARARSARRARSRQEDPLARYRFHRPS